MKVVFRLSVRSLVELGRMDAFVSYIGILTRDQVLLSKSQVRDRQMNLVIFMPARRCDSVDSHSHAAYCCRKTLVGGPTR